MIIVPEASDRRLLITAGLSMLRVIYKPMTIAANRNMRYKIIFDRWYEIKNNESAKQVAKMKMCHNKKEKYLKVKLFSCTCLGFMTEDFF